MQWSQTRYDEICGKLKPFLKSAAGFKDEQVLYIPISGLNGDNLKERKDTASWYTDKTLFDLLDTIQISAHAKGSNPLRVPMLEGYRDMGALMAVGKVEQGTVGGSPVHAEGSNSDMC